jgi:single-strand DNA-binding protein
MANLNKVMLIGNVTRDPELRYTPKGTAVTEVGLAVNRVYSSDDGERREETTFIDVTLWARKAEVAAQYLKKGSPVYFEGRLQLDTWEDKQTGQKRNKLRVVADSLEFLGGGSGGGGGRQQDDSSGGSYSRGGGGAERSEGRVASPPSRPPQDPDLDVPAEDDDIPF